MRTWRIERVIQFGLVLLLVVAFEQPAIASVRIVGSLDTRAFGYQDAENDAHVWLQPRINVRMIQQGGPFSISFIGDYLGDSDDDFSDTGRFRFLRGLIRYSSASSPFSAQVGRFFRYDGVSAGVIDGVDVSWQFAKDWRIAAFGGLLGPRSREFEFEDADNSTSMGGELRWTPSGSSRFVVSYARQEREPGVTRNVIGLSTYHKLTPCLTWFNVLHVRPTDAPFRKFISRLRMRRSPWSGSVEMGIIQPNVADYSWFSSFGEGVSGRFRVAVDRYFSRKKWAGGLEGVVLTAGGKNGFRGGPVVTSPWGQVGYRLSDGDQALGAGPWVSLRADPYPGVDLYVYGALISYEWETFKIASEDLAAARGGVRYTPWFEKALELDAEVQVYRTPQLEYDWRTLVGVSWRFDTGRGQ